MLVEGRSLEDVTPELEAEETPYSADWEGKTSHTDLFKLLISVILSVLLQIQDH